MTFYEDLADSKVFPLAPWLRRSMRATALLLCCLVLGCGNRTPASGGTQETSKPTPGGLDDTQASYADIIRGIPDDPRSEEVIGSLRTAGHKEGVNTDEALMYRCSDNYAGVYFFQACLKARLAVSDSSGEELCRETLAKAPQALIATAALDGLLELTQKRSREEFLKVCDTLGNEGSPPPHRRVTLLRRSEHLLAQGERKAATLDALELLSLCTNPETRMGVMGSVARVVEQSGYLLEAEWINCATEKDKVAAAIRQDFLRSAATPDSSAPAQDGANDALLTDTYLRDAPNLDALLLAMPTENASEYDRLCFFLRLTGLACNKAKLDNLTTVLGALPDLAPKLTLNELTDDKLFLLAGLADTAADCATRVLINLDRTRSLRPGQTDAVRPSEATRLLASISTLRHAFATERSKREKDSTGTQLISTQKKHIDVLKSIGYHAEAIAAYDAFIEQYPASPLTPGLLLRKAAYYTDILKTPHEAALTYSMLRENYPNSPEALEAGLKKALALYSTKEYEDAYSGLQELLTDKLEPDDQAAAGFLSAMCEYAMGENDLAKEHMRLLLNNFGQTSVAPRVLLWLANVALSETDYAQAKKLLEQLTEEYPGSDEAASAAKYLQRLAKING